MKTQEEIEALKSNWIKDPCWDIEDTEGFEDHKEELLAYRLQIEADIQEEAVERAERRKRVVHMDTGIHRQEVAGVIHTFAEIEAHTESQGNYIAYASTREMITQLELMQTQVRATLLLAAQVQRIADLLEDKIDQDAAENNLDFVTRLYDIK